jgi:hypothetical protein
MAIDDRSSPQRRHIFGAVALSVAIFVAGSIVLNRPVGEFVNIRKCGHIPPAPDFSLASCDSVQDRFYFVGSLYLDIDKELVTGLRRADVVIIGNSRTRLAFGTHAVDEYFSNRGLRYFVLGSEGSGFRVSQMILERLDIHPKILIVSNEAYFVDIVEDANRALLDENSSLGFRFAMTAFYLSKKMQRWICAGENLVLKDFYCHGENGIWRSNTTGAIYFPPKLELKLTPIVIPPDSRIGHIDFYMKNARAFLASSSVSGSCIINHLVPWNDASVDVAREMAREMIVPFVFPDPAGYFTFDDLHMDTGSSERWASEFVRLADPYITECLQVDHKTALRLK